MDQTATAERLMRDIHPAELSMPDQTVLRNLRVFVTSQRLIGYGVGESGIERMVDMKLADPCSVPADRSTLRGSLEARLADGSTVWINRGRGCGCGSPLKALGAPVSWTGA